MRKNWYQGKTETWAASKSFPIDLTPLNAARDMESGVIDEIKIVAVVTGTTGSAGLQGGALASMFSQVYVQDSAGERCNVRGSSLRIIDQVEYGNGYADPLSIAANTTDATVRTLILRIPFNPPKARRRRDFGLPIRGFLDGGRMTLVTSAALVPGMGANGFTISSATITPYWSVRDERTREAKSRLCFRDESIAQTTYDYAVAGSLRYALWYNGEINERAGTAWSAQTLSSKTLDIQQINDYIFQDEYAASSKQTQKDPGSVATASAYYQTDTILRGQTVPIYQPDFDQKIVDMPQMQTLNIRTSLSSITTADLPQLITSVINERAANISARVLAVSDPAKAVAAQGYIKAANGNKRGLGAFPANIAKMMPVKLASQTGKAGS